MRESSLFKNFVVLLATFIFLVYLPGFVYGQEDIPENSLDQASEPQPTEESFSETTQDPILDLASLSDPFLTGTFTVDSTGDQPDAVSDGLCATSLGTCTLRAAAQEAGITNTQDRIIFNIPPTDPGFKDHDGGEADMTGGDDYWVINFEGSASDVFKSGVVIDVSNQTIAQEDTNSRGAEVKVNFSVNPAVQGAETSVINPATNNPEVKGQFTTASEDLSKLTLVNQVGHNYSHEWYFNRVVDIEKIGDHHHILQSNPLRVFEVDAEGNFLNQWGTVSGTSFGQLPGAWSMDADSSGNLYIGAFSSTSPYAQKFASDGTFSGTHYGEAGTGLGQINRFRDIVVNSNGDVYIADDLQRRISKFANDGTYLLSWGSAGSGNGQFGSSQIELTIDSSDNIYVVDSGNTRLQKFDANGNYVSKWSASMSTGWVDGNYVYTTSTAQPSTDNLNKYDLNGNLIWTKTLFGPSDGQLLSFPNVSKIFDGTIYVTFGNWRGSQIQLFDLDGNFIERWGLGTTGPDNLVFPNGLTVNTNGKLYVADTFGDNLKILEADLTPDTEIPGIFLQPSGTGARTDIANDSNGNIYLNVHYANSLSFYINRLIKLNSAGSVIWNLDITSVCRNPLGMDTDTQNNIFVVCSNARKIRKYDTAGNFISEWGSSGSGDGQFLSPYKLAIDSEDNVYVTDKNRNDVQVFSNTGSFIAKWDVLNDGESVSEPKGIAIDDEDNIFILDGENAALEEYDTTGELLSRTTGIPITNLAVFAESALAVGGDFIYVAGNTGDTVDAPGSHATILRYVIDKIGPEIDVEEFTDNTTTELYPIFTGTITDLYSPLLSISFSLNADMSDPTDCLVEDNVIEEASENFECYIENGLVEGENTVYFQSIDNKNNETITPYSFTLIQESEEEPEEPNEEEQVYDFDLIDPIDGAVIEDNTPKLDWEDIDEESSVDFYDLYINGKFVKNTGTLSEYQIPYADALPDGDYTWRVFAYKFVDGEAIEVGRTEVEEFTVRAPVPAEPEEPVIPPVTGEDPKPAPEKPRSASPNLPDFVTNVRDFRLDSLTPAAGIVAASATVALSTTLLTAGRDVLEKLGFVIGGIVPKKRRYWGIVFDGVKSQGIPFAVIRVYQNKKLLNTTVTDLDGRYGIPVSESGTFDLEVKAQGFKQYSKIVNIGNGNLQEIVENIALERSGENLDPFRSFFFYYLSEILLVFRLLVVALMVGGFLYSLYLFMQFPILLNLIILLLYIGLFGINMYQEYRHRRNVEGRVIDLTTRTGLPNTTVILYNAKGEQEDVRLTNAKGVAKLRAKSGIYQVQALKSGYVMSDLAAGQSSLELKVDERGYLTKAIFMRQSA